MTTPPAITSPVWNGITKRTVALICVAAAALLLLQITDAFPIVIIAAVLSYLLTPVVRFIERRLLRGRHVLAVLLAFVFVILLFIVLIWVIVPVLFAQVQDFGENLPRIVQNLEDRLTSSLNQPLVIFGQPIIVDGEPFIPLRQLRDTTGATTVGEMFQLGNINYEGLVQNALNAFTGLTGRAFGLVGTVFGVVINLTLLIVLMFYLMKDGHKFVHRAVEVTPPSYQGDARRLFYELGEIWNAYLRGQLLLCFTMGTLTFLLATALGLPNAAILGLLAGLLEFVPNIGPIIAAIPAVLLALVTQSATLPFLDGVGFALVVAIGYFILQNIEAVVMVPRIMGDNLDLHPAVVIIAVIAGASLGGTLGVILAAPATATLRLLVQYIYAKLTDKEPFAAGRAARRTAPQFSELRWVRAVEGTRRRLIQNRPNAAKKA